MKKGERNDAEILQCGKLERVDGLTVRHVAKGTLEALGRQARPLGVLDGGTRKTKIGRIKHDGDLKWSTLFAFVPVASKTSAFEEYRMYVPEETPKFEDTDGIKKSMPATLPEFWTEDWDGSDAAGPENRQLLFDPKPGAMGYTMFKRRRQSWSEK